MGFQETLTQNTAMRAAAHNMRTAQASQDNNMMLNALIKTIAMRNEKAQSNQKLSLMKDQLDLDAQFKDQNYKLAKEDFDFRKQQTADAFVEAKAQNVIKNQQQRDEHKLNKKKLKDRQQQTLNLKTHQDEQIRLSKVAEGLKAKTTTKEAQANLNEFAFQEMKDVLGLGTEDSKVNSPLETLVAGDALRASGSVHAESYGNNMREEAVHNSVMVNMPLSQGLHEQNVATRGAGYLGAGNEIEWVPSNDKDRREAGGGRYWWKTRNGEPVEKMTDMVMTDGPMSGAEWITGVLGKNMGDPQRDIFINGWLKSRQGQEFWKRYQERMPGATVDQLIGNLQKEKSLLLEKAQDYISELNKRDNPVETAEMLAGFGNAFEGSLSDDMFGGKYKRTIGGQELSPMAVSGDNSIGKRIENLDKGSAKSAAESVAPVAPSIPTPQEVKASGGALGETIAEVGTEKFMSNVTAGGVPLEKGAGRSPEELWNTATDDPVVRGASIENLSPVPEAFAGVTLPNPTIKASGGDGRLHLHLGKTVQESRRNHFDRWDEWTEDFYANDGATIDGRPQTILSGSLWQTASYYGDLITILEKEMRRKTPANEWNMSDPGAGPKPSTTRFHSYPFKAALKTEIAEARVIQKVMHNLAGMAEQGKSGWAEFGGVKSTWGLLDDIKPEEILGIIRSKNPNNAAWKLLNVVGVHNRGNRTTHNTNHRPVHAVGQQWGGQNVENWVMGNYNVGKYEIPDGVARTTFSRVVEPITDLASTFYESLRPLPSDPEQDAREAELEERGGTSMGFENAGPPSGAVRQQDNGAPREDLSHLARPMIPAQREDLSHLAAPMIPPSWPAVRPAPMIPAQPDEGMERSISFVRDSLLRAEELEIQAKEIYVSDPRNPIKLEGAPDPDTDPDAWSEWIKIGKNAERWALALRRAGQAKSKSK